MASDTDTIEKAANSLRKLLGYPAFITSIGVGHGVVVVYTNKPKWRELASIPKEWQGWPVQVKRMGKLSPLGGM